MAQINSREMAVLGQITATTSGAGSDIVVPMGYTSAILSVNCPTVSGTTSPTLNVYVQEKLTPSSGTDTDGTFPSGTAFYDDALAFTQLTTSGTKAIIRTVGGGNVASLGRDATLTAATIQSGPLGDKWRVKYVIGGSGSPTFTFSVNCKFIP